MTINVTSYDPDQLKQSLIEFVQSKPDFADFNYEGSAINTIIDLLVRNTHYIAYMANMVATESFLDSAQLRANVVSHAQKLSYIPRSRTSTTAVVDLLVTTSAPNNLTSLSCTKGSSFINTIGNINYSFTNTSDVTLLKISSTQFRATGVELKQGQLLKQKFIYSTANGVVEIPNKNIDSSTIRVFVKPSPLSTEITEYKKLENIVDADSTSAVYFLSENSTGYYEIEFGKNVLGVDPLDGALIEIEYVVVEKDHANNISSLIAASTISGYSNIDVTVTTSGYGGAERNSVDFIKFIAPKIYETQNRAVRDKDYATLMLRDFPFIKSAIAWGGEKNVPPYFGRVFLCAIPQEGFIIADTVKKIIEKNISKYSVASITTEVLDAEYLGLNLDVDVLIDFNVTTDNFQQTITKVNQVITNYNNYNLKTFDFWYNNSLLTQQIKDQVPAVYSIEINKDAFYKTPIKTNRKAKYEVQTLNGIEPLSLKTSEVSMDVTASSCRIYDDGLGVIFSEIVRGGITTTKPVGVIDYISGVISFEETLLNTGEITISVTPSTENFYTERNYVVYIDEIRIKEISNRRVY